MSELTHHLWSVLAVVRLGTIEGTIEGTSEGTREGGRC